MNTYYTRGISGSSATHKKWQH